MNRGGYRPGAGRKRGSGNRLTSAMIEAVSDAKMTIGKGTLPLDYMLKVMRDSRQPVEVRLKAAAQAAPYVHPKMPQAVVVGGEVEVEGVTVEIIGAPKGVLDRAGSEQEP